MNSISKFHFLPCVLLLLLTIEFDSTTSQGRRRTTRRPSTDDDEVTLEMLEELEERIVEIEKSNKQLTDALEVMEELLDDLFSVYRRNVTSMWNATRSMDRTVTSINTKVTKLDNTEKKFEKDIRDLKQIADVVVEQGVKLERVNDIWKGNFRVVNRTFEQLRRKIRFSRPAIRLY